MSQSGEEQCYPFYPYNSKTEILNAAVTFQKMTVNLEYMPQKHKKNQHKIWMTKIRYHLAVSLF